ncbi:hypothetical protein D9M70_564290 [compost metagenome]
MKNSVSVESKGTPVVFSSIRPKPKPQASAMAKSGTFWASGRWSDGESLRRVITSARTTTDSVSIMNWVKARSGAP